MLIDAYLEVLFPKWHAEYRAAFEAGVMIPFDYGPMFGRAIIYKLQGRLHRDKRDAGPSASFPVGSFVGGEVLFPQLGAKLRYVSMSGCLGSGLI